MRKENVTLHRIGYYGDPVPAVNVKVYTTRSDYERVTERVSGAVADAS